MLVPLLLFIRLKTAFFSNLWFEIFIIKFDYLYHLYFEGQLIFRKHEKAKQEIYTSIYEKKKYCSFYRANIRNY